MRWKEFILKAFAMLGQLLLMCWYLMLTCAKVVVQKTPVLWDHLCKVLSYVKALAVWRKIRLACGDIISWCFKFGRRRFGLRTVIFAILAANACTFILFVKCASNTTQHQPCVHSPSGHVVKRELKELPAKPKPTPIPTLKPKKKKVPVKRCVPHEELVKKYGLPGRCNDSHLILDCVDPYQNYLFDLHLQAACGVVNSKLKLRDLIKKNYNDGQESCSNEAGVLVSNASLPLANLTPHYHNFVPRIVHYVSLGCNRTFSFSNFLSVLSVHRFVEPQRIYFHGDCLPIGKWFNHTVNVIPNIFFRKRMRTTLIQGKRPMWTEHETDIIRLQILYKEGGIYLDTDVLVLSKIDDLRGYSVSMGREFEKTNKALGSSFVVAEPHAPFICMWLNAFREYAPRGKRDWGKYAIFAPGSISMNFPKIVHIEVTRFFRPAWFEAGKIYNGFYDWSKNYVLHMWNKLSANASIPKSPEEIPTFDKMNCTIHEVFRYVYFNETIVHALLPTTTTTTTTTTTVPSSTTGETSTTIKTPTTKTTTATSKSSKTPTPTPKPTTSTTKTPKKPTKTKAKKTPVTKIPKVPISTKNTRNGTRSVS